MKMHLTKMLTVCCAILFGAFISSTAFAQGGCQNVASFGSADISVDGPNGELITISTCSYEEEYSTITGVPVGEDIEFSSSTGGYITVRTDSAGGAVVAEGFSPVTVSGASGSNLFPHWTVDDACATASSCLATSVQCTSCATECPDGNIGDACDDGDANTVGDVIGEDCVCAGQPLTGDCLNGSSFGSEDLTGAADALLTISTCSYQEEYSTITGISAGSDVEFAIVEGGYITVRTDSVDGPVVAQGTSPVTVLGASGADLYPHWNTDGACGQDASCVETTVQCLTCGTDCPDGNIGDPCDDGDENTENDVLGEDCVCAGTPIPDDSCLNTVAFASADITAEGPNGELIGISTCSYQEEYSTITGVPAGEDIEFSIVEGGYITVRSGSFDGPVVAAGFSPLTVSAASGADLYPHWNVNDSCEQAATCVETQVQ
ncbi:hypothetical protein O3Q51_13155, partial [Cryomorphaceae bacterium 1068]|nr:hypothetical protein [Cryomorphaceae bacterium 1068]